MNDYEQWEEWLKKWNIKYSKRFYPYRDVLVIADDIKVCFDKNTKKFECILVM